MDSMAGVIESTASGLRVILFHIRNLLADCVKAELVKKAT